VLQQYDNPAHVFANPANVFVAGFVGTSNLLRADEAERATGRRGTYGIRPEKLTVVRPGTRRSGSEISAAGTVAEVVYAGPVTRFVVDLDGGGRLIALEENGHSATHDELRRGDPVELLWHSEHLIEVPEENSTTDDSSTAQRSSS
jgi:putative spermidine/putrescine transport system ATP-binding protein